MSTYDELAGLTRICEHQALGTSSPDVARLLHQMAKDYQQQAAGIHEAGTPALKNEPSDPQSGSGSPESS